MTIIVEGDLNRLNKVKRFSCRECGCVFDADKTEYTAESQYNETYYKCTCPTCGNTVYIPH